MATEGSLPSGQGAGSHRGFVNLGQGNGLLGSTIGFSDKSCWKLLRALTETKYQQGQPPFEARQVFECVCVADPEDVYVGMGLERAVIKVKYQIRGTEESLKVINDLISDDRSELAEASTPQARQRALKFLKHDEMLLHTATNPVGTPHRYTINEIKALHHFQSTACAYTPHLLGLVSDRQPPDMDEQGMPCGFAVFILMTKLPGNPVTTEMLQSKTLEERGELRGAFKTAIKEMWKQGYNLHDCAMRNLIWDEDSRKCFIIDFEDYVVINTKDPEVWWKDKCFARWEIAEGCFGA